MDSQPELIADYYCTTGEEPIWHPGEGRVYWVDITTGRLFRYDPPSDDHDKYHQTDVVEGLTIRDDGSLLLFGDRERVERWQDGGTETVIEEVPDERDSRFNDVVEDPAGRVFCGTMPTDDRPGRLYRLDTDGSVTRVLDGLQIPNGMGFTPDRERMYVTETSKIYRFEYDETTGELSDRVVFVDASDDEGMPDGMTVDADGYVWSAFWNGVRLVRYSPDGTEDRRIAFPAWNPGRRRRGSRRVVPVRPGVSGTEEFRSRASAGSI